MSSFQDRLSLRDRTCLVTGASAGIGLELCGLLAEAGADVIAIGRNSAGLEEAARKVRERVRRCLTIIADLSDVSEVGRATAEALAWRSGVDVLVNNAGVSFNCSLVDQSLEEWDRTMATNLRAPWLIAKAVAPGMIERRRGKIINVSSQASSVALPDHGAYTASKSGLSGLTKVMTAEWACYNIQCNAVCPTVTMTPMGERYWRDPMRLDPMLATIPAGRTAQTIEVCDLILFLATSASDMINGQAVFIDGGYTAL